MNACILDPSWSPTDLVMNVLVPLAVKGRELLGKLLVAEQPWDLTRGQQAVEHLQHTCRGGSATSCNADVSQHLTCMTTLHFQRGCNACAQQAPHLDLDLESLITIKEPYQVVLADFVLQL